ncbi:unnamed protein product, partial [Vitis vinifera]
MRMKDILLIGLLITILTKGASWKVPIGWRDGRVSLASETANFPASRDSIELQKQKFTDKGLNDQDLVALVCDHTIGTSACQFFSDKLYNFNTTTGNGVDFFIEPAFFPHLQAFCPKKNDANRHVALDTSSPNTFNASFFKNLKNGRGILESDKKLWTNDFTKSYMQRFLGIRGLQALNFNMEFGKSMVKMSNIGVKTTVQSCGIGFQLISSCSSITMSATAHHPKYLVNKKIFQRIVPNSNAHSSPGCIILGFCVFLEREMKVNSLRLCLVSGKY